MAPTPTKRAAKPMPKRATPTKPTAEKSKAAKPSASKQIPKQAATTQAEKSKAEKSKAEKSKAEKSKAADKARSKASSAKKAPATSKSASAKSKGAKKAPATSKSASAKSKGAKKAPAGAPGQPVLLSGGNPQIAKADGDAPVQAYIAAMPGWKSARGRWLDALIVRTVPNVQKAVRWNSPFYGMQGQGWFLSYHCFTRYIKVAFIRGRSLNPLPPGESKDPEARYLDIYEQDEPDEQLVASWVRQASKLPGWIP